MQDPDVTYPAPRRQAVLRLLLRIGIVVAVVVAAKLGLGVVAARVDLLAMEPAAWAMPLLFLTALLGYALLLAVPFIPGVEIGIGILLVLGAEAAPFVYLATVTGMMLAFVIGRYVSLDWLIRSCEDLSLTRATTLLRGIRDTPQTDRLAALQSRLPAWLGAAVVTYRYPALAALVNMPGNTALGGGGGIMMAAGFSRLFAPLPALVTVMLATLPVPLAVWLFGTAVLN